VCVIADRGQAPGEWHGDAGLARLTRLAPQIARAPIVFAGASQAALMLAGSQEIRIPRARLIGSAPEALRAAVRSMVAMEGACSPADVALTLLGAPPSGFVVPWSQASIGGYALEHVLTQVQLSRIDARIGPLWPPGPHALGQAAATIVEALLSPSRRMFCVLAPLAGEFRARDRVGVVPASLAGGGIASTSVPELNTRERVRVENALGL
jgi:malate/lactate dehydrogenase